MGSGERKDPWYIYSTWLASALVTSLKCSVCIRFEDKLRGIRNFNPAFIVGSTNLHADTDMHVHTMLLYKKSLSSSIVDYSPIAKALSTLDAIIQGTVSKASQSL